ncbi:inactive carboxypeptidase-like protein X2 [Mya arenaria]|nr:inactive carboxypeptidase-like protein X2 [Mya arenaria]
MCVLAKRKFTSRICGYDKVSKTCFYSFDTDCNVISTYETTKVVIKPDGADACHSTGYLLNGAEPVSDAQITSSTDNSPSTDSRGFRLYTVKTDAHEGSWAAGIPDTYQYIQVRFYRLKHVSGVALQGKADYGQYVTAYKVLYSCDCASFRTIMDTNGYDKVFAGNTDDNTVVTSMLPVEVTALCVRINPVTYKGWLVMRFDILGCPVN